MKKFKCLTYLTSLGILTNATPIVVTSCSNNKLEISLQNKPIVTTEDTKTFTLIVKRGGEKSTINDLKVTNNNPDLMSISDIDKTTCTFKATGIKVGKATIKVVVHNDSTNAATFEIDVVELDTNLEITTNIPTSLHKDAIEECLVSVKYDGANAVIGSCEVESSNENILFGSYSNGKITLIGKNVGKVSLILYIFDTEEHFNQIELNLISVISETKVKYGDTEYIIVDENDNADYEIDPNMFCTFDENDDFKPISFRGKSSDGKVEDININDQKGLRNIYSVSIGSCKDDITSINDNFLRLCQRLNYVDISALSNIKSIGDCFISVTSITQIDLSPLSKLESIGDSFLEECFGLDSPVDLSPLRNLTTIGDWFLYYCKYIKSIDFSALTNIKTIGKCFLSECHELTQINLGDIDASKINSESGKKDDKECQSFAVYYEYSKVLKYGITLIGKYKDAIQEKFPESTSEPYRHWAN